MVALLSVVFPCAGWAAPDTRPPAKPAANPFEAPAAAKSVHPKPVHHAAEHVQKAPCAQKSPGEASRCKKTAGKAPATVELRSGREAIKKALAEPASLEFVDTPVACVIQILMETHKIYFQLDKKAMDDVGVAPDVPITINLKGVSLRSVLNLMLRDLGLTWCIENEVLLITSPERADILLTTEIYDVADLVTCRDEKGELWEDYDQLVEMIISTVAPTTWDSVGGPGSIAPGTFASAKVLVIVQTDNVHEQIAALLEKIREVIKHNGGKSEPPRRSRSEANRTIGGQGPCLGRRARSAAKLMGASGGQCGSGGKPATKP
jgi:hypothetical protein